MQLSRKVIINKYEIMYQRDYYLCYYIISWIILNIFQILKLTFQEIVSSYEFWDFSRQCTSYKFRQLAIFSILEFWQS